MRRENGWNPFNDDPLHQGEPFIIARGGTPLVKVVPIDAPESGEVRRTGFLSGAISSPADFDRMGSSEIEGLFEGNA